MNYNNHLSLKKALSLMLSGVLLLGALPGCTKGTPDKPDENPLPPAEKEPASLMVTAQPLAAVTQPKSYSFENDFDRRDALRDTPVDPAFLEAMGGFSFRTGAELLSGAQSPNVNYSPVSLYYALSLASMGAEGQTRQELMELMGVEEEELLKSQAQNFYHHYFIQNEIGQQNLGNSLWVDDSARLKEGFAKEAADFFYTEMFQGDLNDPRFCQARGQWVKDHTGGVLAPEFEPNPEAVLSILNTVYFKDEWVDNFLEEDTAPATFSREQGDPVTVDFMNQTITGAFTRGENFLRAGLPMKNGSSMIFVLPDEGVSAASLAASEASLREAFTGGEDSYGTITWKVPKFSFGSDLDLKALLMQLGVESAFSGEKADFSRLLENSKDVFIDSVKQQSHIGIDEKGVEAAAFTQIMFCGSGCPEDEAHMVLDRPFLYAIEVSPDAPLFLGLCGDPSLH